MAKFYTMVARCGKADGNANEFKYTLIGSDLSTTTVSGDALAKKINDGSIVVTNMGVTVKGLVSTNGALNKYTTFGPDGNLINAPRCVILSRIEVNGKLTGYSVFSDRGLVYNASVVEAVALANAQQLANGKIKHTSTGDIVSAIGGTYHLCETEIKAKPADKPKAKIIFFGSAIGGKKKAAFAGVIVTTKNAATMSSIHSALVNANETLCASMKEQGVEGDKLASLKLRQYPGAGFYGVYPVATLKQMLTKFDVAPGQSKLLVGCDDLSDDSVESMVQLSVADGSIKAIQEGSVASDKEVIAYAKKVYDLIKAK